MTKEEREEAIAIIRKEYLCVDRDCDIERNCGKCDLMMPSKEPILKAYKMAIQALEKEPCEDAIRFSEKDAIKMLKSKMDGHTDTSYEWAETVRMAIEALNKCDKIEKIIDSYDPDFIANYVRGLFVE